MFCDLSFEFALASKVVFALVFCVCLTEVSGIFMLESRNTDGSSSAGAFLLDSYYYGLRLGDLNRWPGSGGTYTSSKPS